jgi:hypothetical protein
MKALLLVGALLAAPTGAAFAADSPAVVFTAAQRPADPGQYPRSTSTTDSIGSPAT